MCQTIVSLGYTGLKIGSLTRLALSRDLLVVDVRLSPRSRVPVWSQNNLAGVLGKRYVHLPELGNLNFKGGPIQIKDLKAGVRKLRAALEGHRGAILLCVCEQHATCHRRVVFETLETTGEFEMQILTGSDLAAEENGNVQLSLL